MLAMKSVLLFLCALALSPVVQAGVSSPEICLEICLEICPELCPDTCRRVLCLFCLLQSEESKKGRIVVVETVFIERVLTAPTFVLLNHAIVLFWKG